MAMTGLPVDEPAVPPHRHAIWRGAVLNIAALRNPAIGLPLAGSTLGWLILAGLAASPAGLLLCASPSANPFDGLGLALRTQLTFADPLLLWLEWLAMVAAMMLPMTIPALMPFATRLWRSQRIGVTISVIAGYLTVWTALGLPFIALALVSRASANALPALLVAGLALLVCMTPARRRALRRCHLTPLPRGRGMAAAVQGAGWGVRLGLDCALICGPLMAAVLAAGAGPAVMLILTHLLLQERTRRETSPLLSALRLAPVLVLALLGA